MDRSISPPAPKPVDDVLHRTRRHQHKINDAANG